MSNKILDTYRKNLLSLDAALDSAGGPTLRSALEGSMTAADFLETLAEKNITIDARCVAVPKEGAA